MSDLRLSLYRTLYRIRSAETAVIQYYGEDEMKTPMHMSMGEEAIVAGVIKALGPDGQALGTFRSHALYFAMAEETEQFFLEVYGKQSKIANGKAGSMHLSCPEKGFLGASAILSTSIPVSCGAAFANKMQGKNRVTACFFGDGATEEGVFWESLNAACVLQLPVLFVCEDNGLAIHTKKETRQGYDRFQDLVTGYRCAYYDSGDSTDAEEIYYKAALAVKGIKESGRPAVFHAQYYRYLEHVGTKPDFDAGYRDKAEFDAWYQRDPVRCFREKIGIEEAERIEAEIDREVADSVLKAKRAPFPASEQLYKGVYA